MERLFRCKNSPDKFCIVCGLFTSPRDARPFTENYLKMYRECFEISIDINLPWIPRVLCGMCRMKFHRWSRGEGTFGFIQPVIWRNLSTHPDDCYFCNIDLIGATMKKRHYINYPDVWTVMKAIRGSTSTWTAPSGSENKNMQISSSSSRKISGSSSSGYRPPNDDQPNLFSQLELDDLVRDLGLSKNQSELLASRLQEKNLLQKGEVFYC